MGSDINFLIPEQEKLNPKRDNKLPEQEAESPEEVLNDLQIRIIGIPLFGIVIPNLTGLIHNHLYTILPFTLAYAYFIFIAFAIWQGNRFLLFRLREKISWLNKPVQKIFTLVAANVLYTLPLASGLMWIWFRFSAEPEVDWNAITNAVLLCVICVIFITHVYELLFLAKQWESHRQQNEQLQITLNNYQVVNQHIIADPVPETGSSALVKRLLVKKGQSFVPLEISAVAYCTTSEKVTFIRHMNGESFLCDDNLSELEKKLPAERFFRVNRQMLLNASAILSFKSYYKGRIKVNISPDFSGEIFVSQENASRFKDWLSGNPDQHRHQYLID